MLRKGFAVVLFFMALKTEPNAFLFFETGSHYLANLRGLGSNLQASCLSFPECSEYRCGSPHVAGCGPGSVLQHLGKGQPPVIRFQRLEP